MAEKLIFVFDTLKDGFPNFHNLKEPNQLVGATVRLGPLPEYTLEHAALYRARMDT